MEKIQTEKEILRTVKRCRRSGKKIVTVSGSFDIFHAGHAQFLSEAKKSGGILIVLVNTDRSVRLYKGKNHPYVPFRHRVQVLAALSAADYVVGFDEMNPKRILGHIKPDIHCKGKEWGLHCVEREVVEQNGGKVRVIPFGVGFSTTALLQKIISSGHERSARAVFLDRDGTINVNTPRSIHRIEDFYFLPGVVPALAKLGRSGYKLIIVSNQSGVGRGYYTKQSVDRLHRWLTEELKNKGVVIDAIYYCPHHPDAGCACRKPQAGMVLRAAGDLNINLSKSWVVGDALEDIMLGKECNMKTILLGKRLPPGASVRPDYHAQNMKDAVSYILKKTQSFFV